MSLVVYSTIFGETDKLREPRRPGNTRFVLFTDQPIQSQHWEVIRFAPFERPKRACRALKQPSHLVFPEATATLWVDASLELVADPQELLEWFPGEFTGFRHNKRKRITQEAPVIIQSGKGKADAIYAQLNAYKSDGWDTDDNPQTVITNGGFILRRHTPKVCEFNELWNQEVQNRTLRDQMSLDYCAHKVGLKIDYFPGNVAKNEFMIRHSCNKPTNDF